MHDGYLAIGEWDGIPVRVHWMAPLGVIVFTGFRFAPAAWLAFVFLIFVHEVGHALLVRVCRGTVTSIDLTAVGGECHWIGDTSPCQRAVIASGGVLAQFALFAATLGAVLLFGPVETPALGDVLYVFTASNLFVAAFNLLPIPPLDGAQAWRLVPIGASILKRLLRRVQQALAFRVAVRRLDRIDRRIQAGDVDPKIDEQLKRILAERAEAPSMGEGD